MKDKPLVSIIINNYNYGRFLHEAIDSALNQTYSPTEVIVVDDGSDDDSRKIIASYSNKIIALLKENGGQASAFNAGFALSQGEIICFLDSDDIFLPEKVSEIVSVLENHKDIAWCFHGLKLLDTNLNIFLKKSIRASSYKWDCSLHTKRFKLPFIPTATSGLCFTRSVLQLILPMPEAIVITSDNYLKFTALALSKGFFLNKDLSIQKIHGANAYTFRNNQRLRARILILTAYWIRFKFPSLSRFTNGLFIRGVGIYWSMGGIEPEYKNVVNTYLSSVVLLKRIEINFKALFRCLIFESITTRRCIKDV
jgi:glycosyltransferase involved in cell wall biosynthesis